MTSRKQQGFTVVEIVLIVVVIGLLGYIGYTAWGTMSKGKDQSSSQQTKPKVNTPNMSVDPYKGWKEFCSKDYCIKHPADWQLKEDATIDPAVMSASLTPPEGKFTVYYTPAMGGKGGWVDPSTVFFTALSIKKAPNVDGLSVVKGILNNKQTGEYRPMWFVISDEMMKQYYPLKVDEAVDVGFFLATFETNNDHQLSINTGESFETLEEAQQWFKGADLGPAGLILESIRKKN